MKRSVMILSALCVLAASEPPGLPAQTPAAPEKLLGPYRDKSRVLLVFAPTAQDPAYLEQSRMWKSEKPGFEDRQLVVVPVLADAKIADGGTPASLAKRYGVDARAFSVVLVGKDGREALRTTKPLKPDALYGVVDAMPMRRAEQKRPAPTASPTPVPTPHKPDLDHDE